MNNECLPELVRYRFGPQPVFIWLTSELNTSGLVCVDSFGIALFVRSPGLQPATVFLCNFTLPRWTHVAV